jgi:hypothetical protein
MKHLAAIAIYSLLMIGDCSGQSLETITSIEFRKQTRGFLDQVVISRDSVRGIVENHRAEKSDQYASAIDKDGWAKLLMTLKDVSLTEIDGLQSPTRDRAHDGAVHSTLEITFEDGQTISHGFDNENPHADLKPLLDAVLQCRSALAR